MASRAIPILRPSSATGAGSSAGTATARTTATSSRPTTPARSSNLASLSLTASASVFVPKGGGASAIQSQQLQGEPPPIQDQQDYDAAHNDVGDNDFDDLNPYAASQTGSSAPQQGYYDVAQQQQQHNNDYDYNPSVYIPDNGSGNPYYPGSQGLETSPAYGVSHLPHQPLQYHLYQPALPHVSGQSAHPAQVIQQTFFMSPSLREDLQRRQEATAQLPTHKLLADTSGDLGQYWGLIPLDKKLPDQQGHGGKQMGVFGYRTWTYKCTSELDGKAYVLKRIEGYRLASEAAIALVEKWNRIRSANITTVREAFTTRAFNDHSLIFVFDYFPLASTLLEAHLTHPIPHSRSSPPHPPPLIPEKILWSYLIQLTSALKVVHGAGMAVRCLDPSKVLLTGQNRVRITGCSVLDVIAYDGGKNTPGFQQEDLLSLGKLLISLATHSLSAIHNLQSSLDMISRTYSQEFNNALLYLFSKPNHQRKSIDEFSRIIAERAYEQLDAGLNQNDLLEAELSRELENARLFRLMAKFGFINERPEYDHDARWAETGDRYIIKLFRDYVFHQVDEHGRPLIDLSHVLTCLNKLDAGVDEQLALVSRDEQSCLIVSYREVKNCLETSFRELAR